MSSNTGEARSAHALPQMARGDVLFGVVAVLVGLLALIAKLAGFFS